MVTRDHILNALNTDDLSAKLDDLYIEGEGILRDKQLNKLVEYIAEEILSFPQDRCPVCRAERDDPHYIGCPEAADLPEHRR
jgi:hypothetical protein